ncbi:hypothetical protein BDV93DRAFT_542574 [Ceratobasidium sp. AG-I]|nr:hypothetical protein BDV93DRAFT_542574 [Ceratobasidium sp. AG-I]
MALTARATEPPMWDNQIVPTLRKRLEQESLTLSKRMSVQSIPPEETRPQLPRSTSEQDRPSHIPRPSFQSQLSDTPDTTPKGRPRTYSTPRPFERDMPTPASSRSTSPAVQPSPRPSRIPTRPRAGSRNVITNDTAFPPSPEPSPDLWPVAEDAPVRAELTPPTPVHDAHPRRKRDTFVPPAIDPNDETLFDEPAPFPTNVNGSLTNRTSLDEYEHWYRGEGRGGGGRNGGRGEIRVATRTEMLEIASFGHRPSPPLGSSSQNGHSYGFSSEFGLRTIAYDDSTVGTRSMWHGETENVLDEAPLTDLDDVDMDSVFHPGSNDAHTMESYAQIQDHLTVDSHAHQDLRPSAPDPEPDGPSDPVTPAQQRPSRIARATSPVVGPGASTASLVSRNGRSPTPSKSRVPPSSSKVQTPSKKGNASKSPARRGTAASTASKAPSAAAGTSTQLSPPAASTPKSPPRSPRVAAVSPSRNNTPSPRARAGSTGPKRIKKLSTGSGVPHPLADAIPHIPPSQTAPDDGNWDDVVLPTVARRLQGPDVVMLERKPVEEQEEERIPPAPGTFGYLERQRERENAKARDIRRGSGMEMEEFGAWDIPGKKVEEKAEERKKAPSPPPFAAYTPHPPPAPEVAPPPAEPRRQSTRPAPTAQSNGGMVITEADLRRASGKENSKDDDHGAGCCKCVVM